MGTRVKAYKSAKIGGTMIALDGEVKGLRAKLLTDGGCRRKGRARTVSHALKFGLRLAGRVSLKFLELTKTVEEKTLLNF